jgi:glycosyltransferase involved in cell wall biosynthesis
VILPKQGNFSRKLELIGAKVYCAYMPKIKHNPFGFLASVRKIMRICRVENPILIHCNSGASTTTFAAILAARFLKLPILWQIHVTTKSVIRDRILSGLCRYIVGVSKAHCNRFSWLANNPKLVCINNGVDTMRFKPMSGAIWRSKLGISADAILIGTLGQLHPLKGQECLLKALKILVAKRQNLKLVIAGENIVKDYDYRLKLEGIVKKDDLENNVIFGGWIDNPVDYINALDIVAVPSLVDHFPLAVLEAMSCAKPLVASNVGAVSEAVVDGQTGMLVSPGDSQQLAQALDKLLINPAFAKAMGENARRRAENLFSIRENSEKMQNLYRSI